MRAANSGIDVSRGREREITPMRTRRRICRTECRPVDRTDLLAVDEIAVAFWRLDMNRHVHFPPDFRFAHLDHRALRLATRERGSVEIHEGFRHGAASASSNNLYGQAFFCR